MTADTRIPGFLLPGFLGSGKTTLLRDILAAPEMADTAVLINEFGEIGIDHLIVGAIDGEAVVLQNGCVCCALRDDLKQSLEALLGRVGRGEMPRFSRVVIETTGLADPVPILHTLLGDPLLRHQFRPERTIVTLDAVLGAGQLAHHPESVRQVAVADRLILTKADIASPEEAGATCRAAGRINLGATIQRRDDPAAEPAALLAVSENAVADRLRETEDWLAAFEAASPAVHDHHHHDHDGTHAHHHVSDVRSLSIRFAEPIDWAAFGVWLSALLHRHGSRILRVKGILDASDIDGPVVLQAVEHIVHPPVHLPAWPGGERGSRLVFITRGLDPEAIRGSPTAYLDAAARMSAAGEDAA